MMPFRRNTGAEIAKARAAIGAVEADIARSAAEREEMLLASETIEGVRKLDAAIEGKRGDARRIQDRITALQARAREEERAALQHEKDAAVAGLKKKLGRRLAIAMELETAIKNASDAFGRLVTERDSITNEWPAALPQARLEYLGRGGVQTKMESAVHTIGSRFWSPETFTAGIVAAVVQQHENLIAIMEAAPLPLANEEHPDEEVAAA